MKIKRNFLKSTVKKVCYGLLVASMIITEVPYGIGGVNVRKVFADNAYTFTVGNSTYTYIISSDNTITITGYKGTDSRVEIPNEIEGKKVVAIGSGMTGYQPFEYDCENVVEIVIPENISKIETQGIQVNTAFTGCTNLKAIYVDDNNKNYKSIDGVLYEYISTGEVLLFCYPRQKEDNIYIIPKFVTYIIGNAFIGTPNLEEIKVEEGNSRYKSVDGVLFEIGDRNKLVYYPSGKKDDIYVVPQEVHMIEWGAFRECTYIKNINISESVQYINTVSMFSSCKSLESINVDKENSEYKSLDGVLFSADGKTLLQYPTDKNDEIYEIPQGVEYIYNSAFSDCKKLIKLIIPNSVTEIGRYGEGIVNCDNLTIYGEKNSYAQTYAQKNNILFHQISDAALGDVNKDGEVDIKDSALIKRHLAGWEVDINMVAADVNKDGDVNIKDSALIKRLLAGWEIE